MEKGTPVGREIQNLRKLALLLTRAEVEVCGEGSVCRGIRWQLFLGVIDSYLLQVSAQIHPGKYDVFQDTSPVAVHRGIKQCNE